MGGRIAIEIHKEIHSSKLVEALSAASVESGIYESSRNDQQDNAGLRSLGAKVQRSQT
jgi:hypothetical protein